MAGSAGGPSDVSGWYWTASPSIGGAASLNVLAIRAGVTEYGVASSGSSVRCVRAREGQAIPCFFPLAGWAGVPSGVLGSYWTTGLTGDAFAHAVRLDLSSSASSVVGDAAASARYSVRCVRAREGQAIPLFWIVGFLGSLIYEGLAGVRGIQVGASERVWPVQ